MQKRAGRVLAGAAPKEDAMLRAAAARALAQPPSSLEKPPGGGLERADTFGGMGEDATNGGGGSS